MDNRQWIGEELRTRINLWLRSSSVHTYAKRIVLDGLGKDCVDAQADSQQAANILREVCDDNAPAR